MTDFCAFCNFMLYVYKQCDKLITTTCYCSVMNNHFSLHFKYKTDTQEINELAENISPIFLLGN